MAQVSVRDVVKAYDGDAQAVRGINLEIAERTRFVAGFIGSPAMNLLAARVMAASGAPLTLAADMGHMHLIDPTSGQVL